MKLRDSGKIWAMSLRYLISLGIAFAGIGFKRLKEQQRWEVGDGMVTSLARKVCLSLSEEKVPVKSKSTALHGREKQPWRTGGYRRPWD